MTTSSVTYGYHKVIGRRRLKSKFPVPGHVLNREQRPVGKNLGIPVAIGDEDAVGSFYNLWKNSLYGIGRGIIAPEDGSVEAIEPVHIKWCMNGSFHFVAVEVAIVVEL